MAACQIQIQNVDEDIEIVEPAQPDNNSEDASEKQPVDEQTALNIALESTR